MKKVERFLVMLAFIGIIARLLLASGSSLTIVMSLMGLTFLYMYFGFALFNDIRLRDVLKKESYRGIATMRLAGAVLAGLALSMACVGILFKIQSWPGAVFNLGISMALCLTILAVCFTKIKGKYRQYYKRITTRLTIAVMFCALLLAIPRKNYLEFMQRDNPAFIKAEEALWNDPSNKELEKKVYEEQRNMNHH